MARSLPSGTVTFLFSDVEGSTKLLHALGAEGYLWGDTVNKASRLESHGLPGRIQVGATAHRLLCDRYLFEDRGDIEVKGKGRLHAYLLVGRLPIRTEAATTTKQIGGQRGAQRAERTGPI